MHLFDRVSLITGGVEATTRVAIEAADSALKRFCLNLCTASVAFDLVGLFG